MRLIRILSLAITLLAGISQLGFGNTITSPGNWDNTGIWSGANIADLVSENVTMNNNLGVITVRNGFNYVVGTVSMGNGNTLTIENGASLNVGSSGNTKNMSTGNTTSITVNGTLVIWGDLQINNTLTLIVTGTLIVKGNVQIGNGGSLNISGNATIDGDFQGGNNTALTVDGSVSVGGNVAVGNGSTITGTGSMSVGGGCSDGSSTFCGTGPLPVAMLFFTADTENGTVLLKWATASELNFDFFSVERSDDGLAFAEIGRVQGHGTTSSRNDYSFLDTSATIGRLYYRIKTVDFDGYSEYFNIASIDFQGKESLVIYPNPVEGGNLNFATNFKTDQHVRIEATDAIGNVVINHIVTPITNEFSVPISLRPGTYFFRITSDSFSATKRVVVR